MSDGEDHKNETHLTVSFSEYGDPIVVAGFVGESIMSGFYTFPSETGRAAVHAGVKSGQRAASIGLSLSEQDGLRLAYAILEHFRTAERTRTNTLNQHERDLHEERIDVELPGPNGKRRKLSEDAFMAVQGATGNGKVKLLIGGLGHPKVAVWIPRRAALNIAEFALDLMLHHYSWDPERRER